MHSLLEESNKKLQELKNKISLILDELQGNEAPHSLLEKVEEYKNSQKKYVDDLRGGNPAKILDSAKMYAVYIQLLFDELKKINPENKEFQIKVQGIHSEANEICNTIRHRPVAFDLKKRAGELSISCY